MLGKRLLYLVPGLLGLLGGMARYCQLVCPAVQATEIDVTALAFWDHVDAVQIEASRSPQLFYRPCSGPGTQFVRQAMAYTVLHWPRVIIVGHVHFAE